MPIASVWACLCFFDVVDNIVVVGSCCRPVGSAVARPRRRRDWELRRGQRGPGSGSQRGRRDLREFLQGRDARAEAAGEHVR